MKMVGASNGFIRCPFIVEGLVLGVLGGGLAFLIEWGLYNLVAGKIVTGVTGTLISVVPFAEVMFPLLGAYVAATKVVKPETVVEIIKEMFTGAKAKFVPANIAAFQGGMECIK